MRGPRGPNWPLEVGIARECSLLCPLDARGLNSEQRRAPACSEVIPGLFRTSEAPDTPETGPVINCGRDNRGARDAASPHAVASPRAPPALQAALRS